MKNLQQMITDIKDLKFKNEYGFELVRAKTRYRTYRTANQRHYIKSMVLSKKVALVTLKEGNMNLAQNFNLQVDRDYNSFFKNWELFEDEVGYDLSDEHQVMEFLQKLQLLGEHNQAMETTEAH